MNRPAYPFQPFDEAVPPPVVGTTGNVCVTFDGKWLPYVIGALTALLAPQTYESEQERASREAANLIQLFAEQDCMSNFCDEFDVHVGDDWVLYWTCDGIEHSSPMPIPLVNVDQFGTVFVQVGNVVFPGGNLTLNLQNITNYPPTGVNATNTTTSALACSKAYFIAERVHEKWMDVLDKTEAALALGKTLADVGADVINMVLQFSLIGDEALDAAKDYVEGVVTYSVATLRAQDTEDFQAAVRCVWFCHLNKNNGEIGGSNSVVIAPVVEELPLKVPAESAILAVVYGYFMQMISLGTYQRWARQGQWDVQDCEDCTDCEQWEMNCHMPNAAGDWLTVDSLIPTLVSDYPATWIAGVGWRGTLNPNQGNDPPVPTLSLVKRFTRTNVTFFGIGFWAYDSSHDGTRKAQLYDGETMVAELGLPGTAGGLSGDTTCDVFCDAIMVVLDTNVHDAMGCDFIDITMRGNYPNPVTCEGTP